MTFAEMVRPEAIIHELGSTERNGAIRELVESLANCGAVNSEHVDRIVKSITTRERTRGTTGFGKGVAAPHTKIDGQESVAVAIGRSSVGIDFQSLDGEPVFGIFLIASPADQPELHLRAMDMVFRQLQDEQFRKFLRQSKDSGAIRVLLDEADQRSDA